MAHDYRTALVTGASSGIGRALSSWLARRGVRVYAVARRGDELAALRAEGHGDIIPVTLDLSYADTAHARIARLAESCGGLDLVVANAGVSGRTNGAALDWGHLRRVTDINVKGVAATLAAVLPSMVERKRGHLVAVSSLAGLSAIPRHAGYCASKAWVSMFCESLRYDVEPLGLCVTALHPGFVKSEMTANSEDRMPFLLETEDAADRMGRAILRRAREYSFPWQLTALQRLGSMLPVSLYRWLAPRVLARNRLPARDPARLPPGPVERGDG